MAIKKSELYSSLWSSCDELRGGMDASQYKDYILTLLFVKYVSDRYAGREDAVIVVPEGGGFADMVELKGDKEIGDAINKIIGRLAEANDLKGVIDQADFNDEAKLGRGKEMQDRLSRLVAIFEGLDLRANRAEGDDLLGDAYEYLMRHFATESGKSKGQFYTPAEVSRVIAKVIGIGPDTRQDQTLYDPASGSGSLLLKAADEAPRGISIYGQEMDNATWALSRMNMFLHNHPGAEIWRDNTLANPYFKDPDGSLKKFDFAVANPPFSSKAWTSGLDPENDEFGRFEYGIPPTKNGDYAFLLHLITSLKSTGKGAIILPHGVLFRGHKEADIRRNLVRQGFIKGIIGLPPNLFYGTGIPACIIVIDKENAQARTGIFMIDASKGFMKDGNKNRLRSQDIRKIVDVFNNQIEVPRYSCMVPVTEIASSANDYNLNIPRYIDSSEPEDIHDLGAHLHGGIPGRDVDALQPYWSVFPTLRDALFRPDSRPGYLEPETAPGDVRATVLAHPDFLAYSGSVAGVFRGWRAAHEELLRGLGPGASPRELIRTLSEDLLVRFAGVPLLDKYDVYQCLMDHWAGVMQDDIDLIIAEGWVAGAEPRRAIENGVRRIREVPDLVIGRRKYRMDLIPPALIVDRYFVADRAVVDELTGLQEGASRDLEEFIEEHTGEEGLLEDAVSESGRVTKTTVNGRLKVVGGDPEFIEEREALREVLALIDAEARAKRAVRAAEVALDERVFARYATLAESEIKGLVVEDKWFASIRAAIEGEVQRLTQGLAGRVKELDERYARPLPELEREAEELGAKVEEHLRRMGVEWG